MTMKRLSMILLAGSLLAPFAAAAAPEDKAASPASSEAAAATTQEEPMLSNPLSNPPGIVDKLHFFQSADDFQGGELDDVTVEPLKNGRARIVLADENARSFPRSGRWTSPETETAFPFTELVPSWNVTTPEETGLNFLVRTRDAETAEWSPWLYMGQWGRTLHWPNRTIRFEHGKVNVDNLILKRPADAFQVRANFYSYDLTGEARPSLRAYAVAYSGVVEDEQKRAELKPKVALEGDWARSLDVPFLGQFNNGEAIRGSTCSPTSTAMLLAYRGVEMPVLETCMAILDPEYGIFGNWARAVAHASNQGLDAFLTRVRTHDEVKKFISEGFPLIASIKFKEGEFPSNPMKSTGGHLIVIRGLTEEGDAIVNDPAVDEGGEGLVYKWDELKRAWIDKGGVTYVIGPKAEL